MLSVKSSVKLKSLKIRTSSLRALSFSRPDYVFSVSSIFILQKTGATL